MRFRITLTADLFEELVASLERSECSVQRLGPTTVAVDVPRAPTRDQAERELRIYLALWQAQHPAASVGFAVLQD
jgi:hypothetical protein